VLLESPQTVDTLGDTRGTMSFRARLATFFILIVVVPMAAVGFLVFSLIDQSQTGKTDARAAGVAAAAQNVYDAASGSASFDARTIARRIAGTPAAQLRRKVTTLAGGAGLPRVDVTIGSGPTLTIGDRTAVAPGIAIVPATGSRPRWSIVVSELTAAAYARSLKGQGIDVIVRSGATTLASTVPGAARVTLPAQHGTITIGRSRYRVVTQRLPGFHDARVAVSVLSDVNVTHGSLNADRLLAAGFITAFLVLAFFFALLATRALQGQLARFLDAARRLGGGDFSSPIQTSGRDEFAALGEEFNSMSRQLEHRLEELQEERSRVLSGIRRIGEAFASGLDRDALLELSLRTAIDATGADRGRVSVRASTGDPLTETTRVGRLAGLDDPIFEAERLALEDDGIGQASDGDMQVAAVALGEMVPGGPTHGLITVSREGRVFTGEDLELLRSLADRATLAMANINLHLETQRQAVTDDLTGLASHGRFQDVLSAEMEQVRRYQYSVGLIMLDIDNFKSVNDAYGHLQGDLVLRNVADVLRETSRDVDLAARYGGEEMALVLPHTDLEGAYEMAERARAAIEARAVPKLDGDGVLQITASVGVAASSDGDKDDLIAAADNALYMAKHEGKNRTVRADAQTANASAGE
jgi:diguanylate cyclase (GGDEF)-like protein